MPNERPPPSMLLAEDSDQRQEAAQENVVTLIDRITQQYPHHDAVESLHQKSLLGIGNVRWSFAQLQQASIKLAASLSTVGVQRGTRVAAFLFNQAEWPLVFLATLRLGAHFVPLDPRVLSRQEDARYILDKVEARHIFVPDRTLASAVDNISTCTPSRPIFKCVVSAAKGTDLLSGWISLSQLMETAPESAPSSAHLTPNDTILLLCTSGTTSRPKVCPHTSITIATPALALADHFDITPDQPLCQHLPSFHVFSVVMTLAFWLSGATVIFPSLSFDAAASFDALGSNVRTHMPCVPAMAQAMKAYAASHDHALPAPYHIILGGASISSDVVDLCRSLGTQRITAGYGMTEGVATLIHAMGSTQPDVVDSYVCLGRAIAGARLRICRPATRDAVHREEIGELHQGGPPVISGYLGATIEDNSCCYKKDGIDWCATGDQGYMDSHGRVYLLGRYKDLIIRGGENISPTKIEQCLLKFPHISAVCAIGVPDTVAGEVPVAIVQTQGIAQMTTTEILSIVATELGHSFSPTMILDLKHDLGKDAYPTTTSGKIQKACLQKWVVDYLDQVAATRQEAGDIFSELAACWSAVSGVSVEEIDHDRPIRSFTDSTMIIQFLHIAAQKGWKLTFKLLTIHTTIRQQAMFLNVNKLAPSQHVNGSPLERLPLLDEPLPAWASDQNAHKDLVSAKLRALGLEWSDVESVLPMTDYSSNFSRDQSRPTAWNFRFTWSVENSMNEVQLLSTLETWFKRHSLLRCTSVICSEDLEMILVMRPHATWLKHQIIHAGEVKNMEAATQYRLNDPEYDFVNGTGPFFKVAILKTQSPTAFALVMHFHHALYDALSLIRWIQDLKHLLNHNGESSLDFLPYNAFAEQYYEYRSSRSADEAVDFHVSRLSGISSSKNALWPPNASASREVPCDVRNNAPRTMAKEIIDKSCGMQGTNCYLRLPEIAAMKTQFAISAPIVAMTACALVNIRQTKASEAIFNNLLSGRTWPLADKVSSDFTNNMLEVDGPTMTYTVSRIRFQKDETTVQLLQRVQNEQDQLAIHAHAPLNHINQRLKEVDTENGAADVSLMDTIYRRQAFDWLLEQYSESDTDTMRLYDDESRSNLGFVWFPFIKDGNLLHLNVTYDHALLSTDEVHEVTTEFMCASAWLSDPANAHKPVSECQFSGYEVAYQQPL